MQAIVSRLEAWLVEHHPTALEKLAPGVTEAQLAELEGTLGVTLPDGFRALYAWRDGTTEVALMNNRALMPLADIARVREQMAGFCDDGTFERRDWWHKSWIPFLANGAGSYLVWDPSGSFEGTPGQVLEFWSKEQDRNIQAPHFDDWLTAFVDSLEAGVWSLDEGDVSDDPSFDKFLAKRFPGYPVKPIKRDGKRAKPSKKAHGPRADKSTVAADLSKPVRAYRATEKFEPADRVEHPQFGQGIVESLPEPSKISVFFPKIGRKVLVHAGSRGAPLTRPRPFDHTKPGGTKPPT